MYYYLRHRHEEKETTPETSICTIHEFSVLDVRLLVILPLVLEISASYKDCSSFLEVVKCSTATIDDCERSCTADTKLFGGSTSFQCRWNSALIKCESGKKKNKADSICMGQTCSVRGGGGVGGDAEE